MTSAVAAAKQIEPVQDRPPSPRLLSLDVFRGATIAAMMLVNNPGTWNAVYKPLLHAPWHGWTFTDLVFPFFLWIVGAAIPLSTARRLEAGQTRADLLWHALRRGVILFALGFFLNLFSLLIDASLWRQGFTEWLYQTLTTVRISGVLQRIGICYFMACGVYLFCCLRGQIIALLSLLGLYWCLMMLVPVPGQGAGVLEKQGNLAQYVDNLVLNGPRIGTHVWNAEKTWDPEGIISTIPAIASCLFGVLAGQLLRARLDDARRAAWLFFGSNLLLALGSLMNVWMPINKNLWTSSYAVFMAGMAGVCFAACYWILDVQGWRRWSTPLEIYGKNAIAVFMISGILGRITLAIKISASDSAHALALKTWLFQHLFGGWQPPRLASLAWAMAYVLLLYLIAWLMHRRRWYLKV
jgi:predicted acyltransferase